MAVPELRRQLRVAGVQQAEVVERAVVLVVLGRYAEDAGLDAQVDVLRHQHHRRAGARLAQFEDRGQDAVVRHPAVGVRGLGGALRGLEQQAPDLRAAAQAQVLGPRQAQAGADATLAVSFDQLVDEAADLARVTRDLGRALLGVVEFFENGHRDEDVVLFEAEQGGRVVHEHVGVEHVDALAFGHHLGEVSRSGGGARRAGGALRRRVAGEAGTAGWRGGR